MTFQKHLSSIPAFLHVLRLLPRGCPLIDMHQRRQIPSRSTDHALHRTKPSIFNTGAPVSLLPSLRQVTLAVRFSPVLYRLRDEAPRTPSCFDLPYRMIFAVATASSVLVYDTQVKQTMARCSLS